MSQGTAFHKLYTPEAAAASRRKQMSSSVPGLAMNAGSDTQCPALEIVDALSYYFENSLTVEIPAESSEACRNIARESTSTWRLLIEIFRMEALCDRIGDQLHEEGDDSLRHGFVEYPHFRRLMAVLRWSHWVNAEEDRASRKHDSVRPSKTAYPTSTDTGKELPIDSAIRNPDRIHAADLSRERNLLKQLWTLLTQGKVMEGVDLCVSSGHRWRGGVLHASSGHIFMGEDSQDEVPPDWVESVLMAPLFGLDSGEGSDTGLARLQVKRAAREILKGDKKYHGIDELDAASTAFLCGDESIMRSIPASANVDFWISIHCLKEAFAAYLLGEGECERFDHCGPEGVDSMLGDSIQRIVNRPFSEKWNQLKEVQYDLILGDYSSVMRSLQDWIEDGICVINGMEVDVDLSSPGADLAALTLLRSLASNLVTVLRDLIARDRQFDVQQTSSIIVGNIECMVAQLKASSGLLDDNQLIVDSLNLLTDDNVKINVWAWFLRQHASEPNTQCIAFPPIVSLLESFPIGAFPSVTLLIKNSIERNSEMILSHAFGTALEAGREISFAVGCANSVWLTAQSAAKSTGSGIYLDLVSSLKACEDPDEAIASIVPSLADIAGEALLVLVLADLQAARNSLSLLQNLAFTPSGHKLMSLQAASEGLNDEQAPNDILNSVSSSIQILDRVSAVMERNSLLEQQRANLAQLNGRSNVRLNPSASTETRRKIMEAQRLIESSSELVLKLVDEIVKALSDILKSAESPIDPDASILDLPKEKWRVFVSSFFDVLLESCVQAIALIDDRRRQEAVQKSVKASRWVEDLLGKQRVNQILEEIN